MGAYDFRADLKEGQGAEDLVLGLIRKKYPKAHRIEGYFPDYDIIIPEINKTVEVKMDTASKRTGNYFIETEYNSEACGIVTSKADWWCEVDDEYVIFADRLALYNFLYKMKEVTLPPKQTSKGGKGYLIPKRKLREWTYSHVLINK